MGFFFAERVLAEEKAAKEELVNTLKAVTDGKLYVEVERVRREGGGAAARAREELTRAGVCDKFAARLAALEAAISTTSQALQQRQKALEEMEAASRSVEEAQARVSLPVRLRPA